MNERTGGRRRIGPGKMPQRRAGGSRRLGTIRSIWSSSFILRLKFLSVRRDEQCKYTVRGGSPFLISPTALSSGQTCNYRLAHNTEQHTHTQAIVPVCVCVSASERTCKRQIYFTHSQTHRDGRLQSTLVLRACNSCV